MSVWLLVVIPLVVGLVVNEMFAWLPYIGKGVTCATVRLLPVDVRSVYREEWLAEIDACGPRGLYALMWSLSLVIGAIQLRRELGAAARTARANADESGTPVIELRSTVVEERGPTLRTLSGKELPEFTELVFIYKGAIVDTKTRDDPPRDIS